MGKDKAAQHHKQGDGSMAFDQRCKQEVLAGEPVLKGEGATKAELVADQMQAVVEDNQDGSKSPQLINCGDVFDILALHCVPYLLQSPLLPELAIDVEGNWRRQPLGKQLEAGWLIGMVMPALAPDLQIGL